MVRTPQEGCPPETCPILLQHGQIADKYIRQMNCFYTHLSVDKHVIMPDEHTERSIPTKAAERTSVIAQFVGTFKRLCNKEYGENIWQDRYYDHVIRNQQDYDEIWQYIENNPKKWLLKNK